MSNGRGAAEQERVTRADENPGPARKLRRWVRSPAAAWAGACVFGALGAGKVGSDAFLDSSYASTTGKWEDALFVGLGTTTLLGLGLLRYLENRPSRAKQRLVGLAQTLESRGWHLLLLALWTSLWAIIYVRIDPDWIATGVDWHDSFLCAYAFVFNDPPFYSHWRYPLYPGLAATLTTLTGLELSVSLQLVSRAASTFVVVPLYVIGSRVFGRFEAVFGIVLLLTLETFRHNAGTVTAYPLLAFLGATAVAGLVVAMRGGCLSIGIASVATGMMFTAEPKSLAPGLTLLALCLFVAASAQGSVLKRLFRLVMVPLPVAVCYLWMHSLPVRPITLEEQASSVLVTQAEDEPVRQWTGRGYLFGHFDDIFTVPRTLLTIRAAQTRPELRDEVTRRRNNSINRLRADYAGISWRVPLLCLSGLLLPLLRRGRSWRERLILAVQLGCVSAYVLSAIPLGELDYQERYVAHAVLFLPLLGIGAVGELLRWLTGAAAGGRVLRGALLCGLVAFVMFWDGSGFAIYHPPRQFDPRLGGRQERQLLEWARRTMKPNDILYDTTWMMTATLLAGEFAVARPESSYPPGGAPGPSDHWRVTRPWPDAPDGRRYVLVGLVPEDNNPFAIGGEGRQPLPGELRLRPESERGARLYTSTRWETIFTSTDGMAVVRVDTMSTPPPWWKLPPGLLRSQSRGRQSG